MRDYELAFIIHPQVEGEDVAGVVEEVGKYISDVGGEVTSTDVWGSRRLAYPIKKQENGTYVILQAQVDAGALKEIERNLKLNENVLRYLLIRQE